MIVGAPENWSTPSELIEMVPARCTPGGSQVDDSRLSLKE